ncbi:hypothetical protein [Kribbella sp. NPDC055071]
MATYQVVIALLRSSEPTTPNVLPCGRQKGSWLLLARMRRMPSRLAGSLWLISSVIAAGRSDRTASSERLAEAARLADLLAHDGNHWWTGFGPTNVRIHRASVAAEFGDPPGVLRAATGVDTEVMPACLRVDVLACVSASLGP